MIFSITTNIQNIEHTLIFREVDYNYLIFHFYFLAKDLLLNIVYLVLNFFRDVKNIPLERTVSQIFYLGPISYFV